MEPFGKSCFLYPFISMALGGINLLHAGRQGKKVAGSFPPAISFLDSKKEERVRERKREERERERREKERKREERERMRRKKLFGWSESFGVRFSVRKRQSFFFLLLW